MTMLGAMAQKIATAITGSFRRVDKVSSAEFTAASATATFGSSGTLSSLGVTPRYETREALAQFGSWVYNCASRNATIIASAHLRLYATRAKGELPPQYAKYRRMSHMDQAHLMKRVSKAIDANISQRWADGEVVEIVDHPFLDLMMNVNKFRDHFDHMEETSIFSDCTGDAYWYIQTGRGLTAGIPSELWLLPTQNVSVVPDPKTFIKGYLYGGQQAHVALTPEEVVHFRRPNIKNQYYGMGRIEAAFNEITGLNNIAELESDRARNRGVQDLHFQLKGGDLTENQKNDYNFQFQNLFARNRRNPYTSGFRLEPARGACCRSISVPRVDWPACLLAATPRPPCRASAPCASPAFPPHRPANTRPARFRSMP